MNIFLLGGWVARPSAFCFVAFLFLPCLILSALHIVVAYPVPCLLCCPCSSPLVRAYPYRTLLALPVPSMPSISASLGSYLTLNENTPRIFMHFLLTLLHNYAMFN